MQALLQKYNIRTIVSTVFKNAVYDRDQGKDNLELT